MNVDYSPPDIERKWTIRHPTMSGRHREKKWMFWVICDQRDNTMITITDRIHFI